MRRFLNVETRVLVYKQTVLSLCEYVSFVMTLSNKDDVDKLKKLQSRGLRVCYDIQNPRDLSTVNVHAIAKVELLQKRRMLQLLDIIYDTTK